MEQFAGECLEQLSVGADDTLLATDQRAVCRRYLQRLLLRITSQGIDQQQCAALLQEGATGLGPGAAATLLALCRTRPLREALVRRALAGVPALKDYDWNVKLGVSSSRVSSLQQPLLSLTLDTVPTKSNGKTAGTDVFRPRHKEDPMAPEGCTIFTELTLAQVDELVTKLTAAQYRMAKFK